MEPDTIVPMKCLMKEVSVEFAIGYTKAEFKETIEALASGKLMRQPMITDIIGLDEVPAMFDALRSPASARRC